jgi:hypothetical protein
MKTVLTTLALIAATTLSHAAAAHDAPSGFRHDVPAVMKAAPPLAAPRFDPTRAFHDAYAAAGRPRIAVYWNRQLGDSLATRYEEYDRRTTTVDGSASVEATTTGSSYHVNASADAESNARAVVETVRGTRALGVPTARENLDESTAWQLESAFYQPWLGTGARLVDRALTMRTLTGGKPFGAAPDIQSVEVGALLGKADYLMEILVTNDAESPIGSRFRVTVKDVRSGQIVALASTRAMPSLASETRWVPTASGFEKRTTTEQATLEDYGRQLAHESMMQLVRAWGARS